MKAIIKTGGKQYFVSENDVIFVEKLNAEVGSKVKFDEVLMVDGKVGTPFLTGASVEGVVEKQGKGKKIRIFRYSQKDRSHRKTQGHRQPFTSVKITKING